MENILTKALKFEKILFCKHINPVIHRRVSVDFTKSSKCVYHYTISFSVSLITLRRFLTKDIKTAKVPYFWQCIFKCSKGDNQNPRKSEVQGRGTGIASNACSMWHRYWCSSYSVSCMRRMTLFVYTVLRTGSKAFLLLNKYFLFNVLLD